MRKCAIPLIALALLFMFSGCRFISDTFVYNKEAKEFASGMMKGDYNKCISMMDFNSITLQGVNVDSLKQIFVQTHDIIQNQCGPDPEYTMMSSEKNWSVKKGIDNYTLFYLEFKNDKRYGVIKYAFNDDSKKIAGLVVLNVDLPIPSLAGFWVFAGIGILMVLFNLFAINKLRLSKASGKWIFYLFMIFLNFPVLGYNVVTGFYLKLLAFQILGMGISKMGYLGTAASVGFPVVAIFILLGLRFGWVTMEE
jgi:hypothetical protein